MNEIIQIVEDEPMVSHRVIAEFTDNEYKSIKNLIVKHKDSLETFGDVSFKKECPSEVKLKQKTNPDYRPSTTYFLNEPQSTLLITFLQNTPVVVKFKLALVKEFYELRTKLSGDLTPALNYKAGKVAHILHSNPNSNQDPQFMKIVKELYGAKATRKYFAPIIGIEYEEQEVITDDNEPDVEIKSFVDECIDFDSNSFTSSKVVYKAYMHWCDRQGIVDMLSHRHFTLAFNETTRLTSKQKRFNSDRVRGYDIGIRE